MLWLGTIDGPAFALWLGVSLGKSLGEVLGEKVGSNVGSGVGFWVLLKLGGGEGLALGGCVDPLIAQTLTSWLFSA